MLRSSDSNDAGGADAGAIPRIRKFLGYCPFRGEGKSLGQRIPEMRIALGFRQDQLALQLDVDPSTLGQWERGEQKPLNHHLLPVETSLDSRSRPEAVRELEL